MKSLSTIVILNHEKRLAEGKYMKKILDKQASPLGIETVLSIDRTPTNTGIWENYRKALIMKPKTPEKWRLIVHDDIMFPGDALKKILHIMDYAPDEPLSFYNPTNKAYLEAHEKGKHVLRTNANFWSQAMATPIHIARRYDEWADKNVKSEYKWEDRRMGLYFNENNIFANCVIPSLVQHVGYNRSLFKIPGRCGKYYRNSKTYDSNFNVHAVDWGREFKNPHTANITTADKRKMLK